MDPICFILAFIFFNCLVPYSHKYKVVSYYSTLSLPSGSSFSLPLFSTFCAYCPTRFFELFVENFDLKFVIVRFQNPLLATLCQSLLKHFIRSNMSAILTASLDGPSITTFISCYLTLLIYEILLGIVLGSRRLPYFFTTALNSINSFFTFSFSSSPSLQLLSHLHNFYRYT